MTIPAAAEGPKGTKIQRQEVSRSAAANKRIETRRVPENIPGEDRPNTLAGGRKDIPGENRSNTKRDLNRPNPKSLVGG